MKKVFLTLFLFSLLLNFTDRVIGLGGLKRGVGEVLTPLQWGMTQARVGIQAAGEFLASLPIVYRENLQLRENLVTCQSIEVENRQLAEENETLRRQLGAGREDDFALLPVRVVGFTQQEGEELVLLRGDIKLNQVVVLGKRLIGLVVGVDGLPAKVRTVFSAQSRLAVEILGDAGTVEALAEGKYSSEVHVTNILAEKKVEVGDLVVTSGAAGKYPRGLLVGEIEEVFAKPGEVYKSARLKLSWGVKELRVVFVIK